MAISRDSTVDLDQIGTRVRILTGIESTEIDDTNLSELISMAIEWFEDQTSLTYAVDTSNAYDNAVIYYTCYLASIAQNGMGIENLKLHIQKQFAKQKKIKLEYIEIVNINNMLSINEFKQEGKNAICIAANINSVRLIDNIIL